MSKIPHHFPDEALVNNMTGRVDPEYEAEVEAMTARRELAWEKAERALENVVRRHENAKRRAETAKTRAAREHAKREIAKLWEEIEARRAELAVLQGIMQSSPQSAAHRGSKSHRTLPARHGLT